MGAQPTRYAAGTCGRQNSAASRWLRAAAWTRSPSCRPPSWPRASATGGQSARELVQASLDGSRRSTRSSTRSSSSTPRRARRRPTPSRRGDERPFAGVPIAIKNNLAVAGLLHDLGSRFLGGHRPTHNAYLVRRLRDAGFVDRRHDEAARVRDPADDRAAPLRPDAQPVGPRAHAGRLVRRLGGGRRRRAGPDRARQRRRRLDPHPGRLLRAGRAQAQPRPHLARARPRRLVPRRATACSRARSPRPRCCSTCWPATRPGDATWAPPPAEPFAPRAARPRPAADRR